MRKVIMIIAALAILAGCGTKQNNDIGDIPELPITTETTPNTTEMVPNITEQEKNTGQNLVEVEESVIELQQEVTLPEQEFRKMQDDIYILARLAMAEAEGEGLLGKAAVVRVVLNRMESPDFPDTVAEVVFQPNQFCTGKNGRYWEVEPDEDSYLAVEIVLEGWNNEIVHEALYFESSGRADIWHAQNLEYTGSIGNHNFYR